MTILKQLQTIKNIEEFAKLINIPIKKISSVLKDLSVKNYKKYYNTFHIPKKSGGKREICAPLKKLQLLPIQKQISNILYFCYEEIKPKTIVSFGFQKKLSIFDNSNLHTNKNYVFNVDLKDFFPTFTYKKIKNFFINNKNFKLNSEIANIIATLSCYYDKLPQGSPCSPIISNLITISLDEELLKLSQNLNCIYSRYADDITFSTDYSKFPIDIAKKDKNSNWTIGNKLKYLIEKHGFNINYKKICMQYKTNSQTCVGLVVNQKVNIKRTYSKKVRSICDKYFKGKEVVIENLRIGNIRGSYFSDDETKQKIIHRIEGRLNFIYSIKKYNLSNNEEEKKKSEIIKLYRIFIFIKLYDIFYSEYPTTTIFVPPNINTFESNNIIKELSSTNKLLQNGEIFSLSRFAKELFYGCDFEDFIYYLMTSTKIKIFNVKKPTILINNMPKNIKDITSYNITTKIKDKLYILKFYDNK